MRGLPQLSRSRVGNVLLYVFLAFMAVFMSFPLVYQVLTAFKPINELFLYPPRFYVLRPTLKNFSDMVAVLGDAYVPFSRYLFNSVIVTLSIIVGHLLVSAMAAYPLAKHHNMRYRNGIFKMVVYSLMFSSYILGVPRFLTLSMLGALDTYWALILPQVAGTLGLFLLKSFIEQIPESLIESARIDGAGEMRILWTIVMPAVRPAWLTLMMLMVQSVWGDAYAPSLYIFNDALKTLPVISSYLNAAGITRIGAGAAFSLILFSVPVIFFIFSQSKVIETMKSAGIKE